MKAIVWRGKENIVCEEVPDPRIEHPRDAVIRVTSCAICGSDLHLYDGFMLGMQSGDVLGHEFMGEVMEVGSENKALKVGDRVVVPFTICCGACDQCVRSNFSLCERSNRNAPLARKMFGHATAGLYGYTHLTGGYAGGQAEYVRVPYADFAPVKVPDGLSDDKVLFLGDILPTAWQAAAQCEIEERDTVAVWGAGPVGLLTVLSAIKMGAKQVICIDSVPERLQMAADLGAITIDFEAESVRDRLDELTQGRGPEKCIDAVGMEAHAPSMFEHIYDRTKQALMLESDRAHVLREMIFVCRPGGTLSVPGVYGGMIDKVPFGALMNKGLTLRTGQTHVKRWTDDLLRMVAGGEIDPTFIITHKAPLEEGPNLYRTFRDKEDGCVKVILNP